MWVISWWCRELVIFLYLLMSQCPPVIRNCEGIQDYKSTAVNRNSPSEQLT